MEQQLYTPVGIVRCGLNSSGANSLIETKKYENGQSEVFKTIGYQVEMISFRIKLPLYNGENIIKGCGWIFRIEKINSADELVEAYCMLDNHLDDIEFDSATGQYLDAIQADTLEWTLHIGTEDGEVLNSRAENNDWFPSRLKNDVSFYQSITEMKQNGFLTKIPLLDEGEKIHIQYLIAYDRNDRQKVNTWLAVDEPKRNLENWIGLW